MDVGCNDEDFAGVKSPGMARWKTNDHLVAVAVWFVVNAVHGPADWQKVEAETCPTGLESPDLLVEFLAVLIVHNQLNELLDPSAGLLGVIKFSLNS